jgi:hypothetical protein
MSYRFSQHDKEVLKEIGIAEEDAQMQLTLLQNGSNYIKLDRPATVGDGIFAFSEKEIDTYASLFDKEKGQFSISRVIPASGMATRMFKFLHYFLDKYNPEKETLRSYLNRKKIYKLAVFLGGIEKFPFYKHVRKAISDAQNGTFEKDYRYRFIAYVVEKFGKLPKAMVPFHNYGNTIRTAAEEQLLLSKAFAVNKGVMNIHFTIPPSSTSTFKQHLSPMVNLLAGNAVKTNISYSHQETSTDTVALRSDGTLLRDEEGKLVFRAGGHGALIGNLNALQDDIFFLSNIDNISIDKYHTQTARYKKMLAGVLISLQNQLFQYSHALEQEDGIDLIEVKTFVQEKLHVSIPETLRGDDLVRFLKQKLARPLRVCGMVKNEGEPGGGPFWVTKGDNISLQIVESEQVNTEGTHQKALFKKGTHFNPVDIVCGVYDHKGNKYDLTKFVDYDTYFIAEKSVGDVEIKALERPGLWNGAMADWNTVFVEVPVRTFNPVKTVNDLLRPMHQSM